MLADASSSSRVLLICRKTANRKDLLLVDDLFGNLRSAAPRDL